MRLLLSKEGTDQRLNSWGLVNQRGSRRRLRLMLLSAGFLNHAPDLELHVRDGAVLIARESLQRKFIFSTRKVTKLE